MTADEQTQNSASRCRLRAVLGGLIFSITMVLAFDPVGFWPLVILAPLPLMRVVGNPGTLNPASAGFWAGLGSLPWWFWCHNWIAFEGVSAAGVIPLTILHGFYVMLFVWIAGRIVRTGVPVPRPLMLAVVWVAVEFFRGRIAFHGYPWFLVSHPLIEGFDAALAWPAAIVGAYGVSLLAVLPASLAATNRRTSASVALIGGTSALWIGGAAIAPALLAKEEQNATRLRVAVAQTNVPQDNKLFWDDLGRYRAFQGMLDLLAQSAEADPRPDLIVFPEAMFPGRALAEGDLQIERAADVGLIIPEGQPEFDGMPAILDATILAEELKAAQASTGIPILVGAAGYEGLEINFRDGFLYYEPRAEFNSVFAIDQGRVLENRYDKIHLTPFGEVMPYISAWPWLEQKLLGIAAGGMSFGMTAASDPEPIVVEIEGEQLTLAAPICFEATLSSVCRELVMDGGNRRASLMVNLTNDGWFGDWTAGRSAHLQAARWRCVELATPMIRAANTGISAVIDRRGRIVSDQVVPLNGRPTQADRVAGVLTAEVSPAESVTIYARVGDAVGWLCLAFGGALAGLTLMRQSPGPRSADESM